MKLFKEYLSDNETRCGFYIVINHRNIRGSMVAPHWHDYTEILYILDGEAEQIIDNSKITLTQGEIVIIEPGKIHATSSITDDCYIIVILLMPDSFQDITTKLGTCYLTHPYEYAEDIKRLFCEISEEYTLKQAGYQDIVKGFIYTLLGYLIRNKGDLSSQIGKKSEMIVEICKNIDENIEKPLTLKEISHNAGYSYPHFSKLFKEMTGKTFKNYIDNVKMLKAKRLILFEGLSVNETASRLGYDNPSTFCRAFKRVNNYPPSSLISKDAEER